MFYRRTGRLSAIVVLLGYQSLFAVDVAVDNLRLVPPSEPVNVLEVEVSGGFLIGSDTQKPNLSGWADVDLDLNMASGDPILNTFAFRDGDILLSDVTFSLAFGNIQATTLGLGGAPSTPGPPGLVNDGELNAVDHLFTINRGVLVAAGETTDFATEPLEATGTGTGLTMLTEILPATSTTRRFEIRVDLPVAATQVLTVENVPFVGTADLDITVTGQIVAQKVFDLVIPDGDFNLDGVQDCGDLRILYDRAIDGSDHATFDINSDGSVTTADGLEWVQQRGFRLGDANLDGGVDETDLQIWESNFAAVGDFCSGDFNADGLVDGSDFNLWNENYGEVVNAVPVPEPNSGIVVICSMLLLVSVRRIARTPAV